MRRNLVGNGHNYVHRNWDIKISFHPKYKNGGGYILEWGDNNGCRNVIDRTNNGYPFPPQWSLTSRGIFDNYFPPLPAICLYH